MDAETHSPLLQSLLECSFILLDKPRGPSSHEVTTYVKKLLGARRTGHAGTLDPQVSGVMVIGLNRATRLIRFITAKDKTYVGVMRLRTAPKDIGQLQAEINKQVGTIMQMPPKMSAVAKRWRQRKVYEFRALELQGNTALFVAKVEAGTYIRVLCTEVGKAFGGGMMIQLRRTEVGETTENQLVTLPELADALWLWKEKGDEKLLREMLIPAQQLVGLPSLQVKESALAAVSQGKPLSIDGVEKIESNVRGGDNVKLMTIDGRLIGIAKMAVGAGEMEKARHAQGAGPAGQTGARGAGPATIAARAVVVLGP